MSIYLVDFKNDKFWKKKMDICMKKMISEMGECNSCAKKMSEGTDLWAYHAITHGFAFGEWWCSRKCTGIKDLASSEGVLG